MFRQAGGMIASAALLLALAPASFAQPSRYTRPATPTPAPNPAATTVNPAESSQEFNDGAEIPRAAPEAVNPTRAVAFSLGASIGFASYHATDLIEFDGVSDTDLFNRLIRDDFPRSVELMCQSVDTAKGIVRLEMAYRRSPLREPPACDRAAMDEPMRSGIGENVHQEYYNSLLNSRETWGAQLQAMDPMVAAAYRAGVNIAIAEGFASRDTDAAAIVANALRNARNDAVLVGLDRARIQGAIDYARPGANMRVLHDMVMSMRMGFEATLANSGN